MLTQSKFPSQESRGKARRIHGSGRPQEEHVQLVVPRHVALFLWKLSIDSLGLNAQLHVHPGLEVAQRGQKA